MFKYFLFIIVIIISCIDSTSAQKYSNDLIAKEYFNNGEYEKAADVYEKLYQNNPDNIQYYKNLIQSYIILKKYDSAEKIVKKQIKRSKNYPIYFIDLGNIYSLTNNADKANKSYLDAINNLKPDIGMMMETCNEFINLNLLDYAIQVVKRSRQMLNNNTVLSIEASKIYSLQNNKQGVIEEQLAMFEASAYQIEQTQQMLQDYLNDEKDYDLLKGILLQKIQLFPDQIFYNELLIWTFIQQQNFEAALTQSIALDKRNNENGFRILSLANYCNSNRAYDVADKAYKEIISRGPQSDLFENARRLKLENQFEKIINSNYNSNDILQLENEYEQYFKEKSYSSEALESIKDYAKILALYSGKVNKAIELLEHIVNNRLGITSFNASCKLDLADYYLIRGDIWDAALLYGQVDKAYKDEPIGQLAKFKNAKLSYYAGEFIWAKAQLDILKSGTSNLIANDALNLSLLISDNEYIDSNLYSLKLYAEADLFVFQHKYEDAVIKLDSINTLFPMNDLEDDILWMKADIHLQKQEYSLAIPMLEKISLNFKDGIWADDAVFKIAVTYQYKLNEPVKAMEYYKRIIEEYDGSLFVVEARKRYRELRGS